MCILYMKKMLNVLIEIEEHWDNYFYLCCLTLYAQMNGVKSFYSKRILKDAFSAISVLSFFLRYAISMGVRDADWFDFEVKSHHNRKIQKLAI